MLMDAYKSACSLSLQGRTEVENCANEAVVHCCHQAQLLACEVDRSVCGDEPYAQSNPNVSRAHPMGCPWDLDGMPLGP